MFSSSKRWCYPIPCCSFFSRLRNLDLQQKNVARSTNRNPTPEKKCVPEFPLIKKLLGSVFYLFTTYFVRATTYHVGTLSWHQSSSTSLSTTVRIPFLVFCFSLYCSDFSIHLTLVDARYRHENFKLYGSKTASRQLHAHQKTKFYIQVLLKPRHNLNKISRFKRHHKEGNVLSNSFSYEASCFCLFIFFTCLNLRSLQLVKPSRS